jgi:hypothetical protein
MNRFIGALLALLVSDTAHAAMKEEVKGYKNFTFGQSLKEAAVSPADCHPYKMYRVCSISGPDLLEQSTRLSLWFFEDKLMKVNISFEFSTHMKSGDRIATYFTLNRMLAEKYGTADEVKEKGETIADITFRGATFTRYWYGPGNKTSINTMMWGNDDHEIRLIVSYYDKVGGEQEMERSEAAEKKARAVDAEKL